jgi:AbrB family looped-hinge helix DNA binding protein
MNVALQDELSIDRLSVLRRERDMETVTISTKFQVVIPKRIRESLSLRPGQKVQAIQLGEHIELVPVVPAAKMRGFLRGIDTTVVREDDRV